MFNAKRGPSPAVPVFDDELWERLARDGMQMGAVGDLAFARDKEGFMPRRKRIYDLSRVQPATKNLVAAVLLDTYPNEAALASFGIRTHEHYKALHAVIREQQVTPEQLDAALGNGKKLTELVRSCAANPYPEIEFTTPWDSLYARLAQRHPAPEPSKNHKTPAIEPER